MRATVSSLRIAVRSRSAACRSNSSPTAWPRLSLMALKRSRSRNNTALRQLLPLGARKRLRKTVQQERAVGETRQGIMVGRASMRASAAFVR